MTEWREVLRRAAISGSSAGMLSAAMLLVMGHRDCSSAAAPVNAISHWIWGDHAFRQQPPSLRYTLPGFVIHHAASVFWAVLEERHRLTQARPPSLVRSVGSGLVIAALACVVDLCFTPHRFTPGFERRLRPGSLALVYVAFGIGLTLPALRRVITQTKRPSR